MDEVKKLKDEAFKKVDGKKFLGRQAYKLLQELAWPEVLETLQSINLNLEVPLEPSEVEGVWKEEIEKKDKKSKSYKGKGEKEKDNTLYTSYYECDDYILEQIVVATDATRAVFATETKFVKFDKESSLVTIVDSVVDENSEGREIKPIVDRLLETGTLLLPSGVEEYVDEKNLIKRIRDFLFSYFELPPFYESFIPYLVLFYWVYDRFPFVPYLHFVGLTGTGKTTAQEVFGSVCYKPIDASGAITMSPLFRTASTWRGTLLLDEFDATGEGSEEMLAFLKSGVGNKAVLRTEGDAKKEVGVYLIKSPKIFTSEQPIQSSGLQSRTIVVEMKKNTRRLPLYRLNQFMVEAAHIRNQLLLWRLRNLNKIDLTKIEFGFPELEGLDRRVQQVITPIYYLSDEETRKEIATFAAIQEKDTKMERAESLEGQIFSVVLGELPNNTLLEKVHIEINKDRGGRKEISEKRLANIIRKVFSLEIKRMGHDNKRFVMVEGKEELVKEQAKYFGLESPPEQVATVAPYATEEREHIDNVEVATDTATANATDAKPDF